MRYSLILRNRRKWRHNFLTLGDNSLEIHRKLKAQVGYKKQRYMNRGEPATVAPNILKRQFDVGQPNQSWVTNIIYIQTYEG